ncbi:MAG: hypothetical protein HZC28_16235 [Spirochaetes bacterium]|nr:hypothetical protein [Spirochaetota bacterium]
MRIINISPLLISHRDEIVSDLRALQTECGVTDVAFSLPLSPQEHEPTMTKAEYLRDLFIEMRKPLEDSGLKVGILLQSLIGHGTPTDAKYQRSINSNGVETQSICPLDTEFQEYIYNAVATVAASRPDFLLVDDDFRLANNGGSGCFCKLHLSAVNKAAGTDFTREQLIAAVTRDEGLRKTWDEVRLSSLMTLAKKVRDGIDAADPGLPCGICICHAHGSELPFAEPMARLLAGKQQPFVRIGNAWYLSNDGRDILGRVYWMAAQMEVLKTIPEILSESDTYPQNRYCTSANALNAQIIFSLINGTTGAKLWVTRLGEYEPESGVAYRSILKENIAMYHELHRICRSVMWDEPTVPIPEAGVPAYDSGVWQHNWTCQILGHMGIPCRVGASHTAGVFMLAGKDVDFFSDVELKRFLSKAVLLDGGAAERLCQRGFTDLLGVRVDSPASWAVNHERLNSDPVNGKAAGKKINITSLIRGSAFRLSVTEENVTELSRQFTIPWYLCPDETDAGPGLTLFTNRHGGRAAVYAAALGFTPFMNEVRREQLGGVIGWLNGSQLPAIVVSDVDMYVRHGVIANEAGGGELLYVMHMGMDALPELRLRIGGAPVSAVEKLNGSGTWEQLSFRNYPERDMILAVSVEPIQPVILKMKRMDDN